MTPVAERVGAVPLPRALAQAAPRLVSAAGVAAVLLVVWLIQGFAARCRPMPPFLVALIVGTAILNTGPAVMQVAATLAVCLLYGCIPAIQETE